MLDILYASTFQVFQHCTHWTFSAQKEICIYGFCVIVKTISPHTFFFSILFLQLMFFFFLSLERKVVFATLRNFKTGVHGINTRGDRAAWPKSNGKRESWVILQKLKILTTFLFTCSKVPYVKWINTHTRTHTQIGSHNVQLFEFWKLEHIPCSTLSGTISSLNNIAIW